LVVATGFRLRFIAKLPEDAENVSASHEPIGADSGGGAIPHARRLFGRLAPLQSRRHFPTGSE
jgi:hypothetical protein